MKRRPRTLGIWVAGLAISGFAVQGCGTGLTLDSTLGDVLNVLTSGDLASAFDAFLSAAGSRGGGLSQDQIAAIEDLQAQLDAGTLDAAGFSDAVDRILGDRAAGMAFGGFGMGGGPFGMHHPRPLGDLLDLTEDQQAQADAIFMDLHSNIDDLRMLAQEDIRAELTDEQLAILDSMKPADAMGGGASARPHRGMRPGPGGPGGPGSFEAHLAELLDLTEDQQAAIDAIRQQLRDDVQAAHEAAREAFRAILTDEQLATLDDFEAAHPGPGMETAGGDSLQP